jgi:RTX toxin RtxA
VPDLTKPVVLLLTGSGGTCQTQGQDLAKMYSNGNPDANVLSVNYRGYGDSDGGLPSKESVYKDGHAMFNHLLEMGFKPEQIIIHGYSMGGAVAAKLHQSLENQGVQVKGVVYDRPMTSVYEAAKAHMGGGPVGGIAGMIGRWGAGPMDTRGKVESLSTTGTTPVLVTYDREVLGPNARTMGDKLHERMGDRAQVVATGTDHEANGMTVHNIGARYRAMLN